MEVKKDPVNKEIHENVSMPWQVHLLRGTLGKVLISLGVGSLWLAFQIFFVFALHPISLVGLILSPVWFIVTYLLLETQSYKLIEVQFKGEEFDTGKISHSSKIEGWSITPEKWREMKIIGSPHSFGGKSFVCDRFDEEKGEVYFPEHPFFSNIHAVSMIDVFLRLKKSYPQLIRENTKLKLEMGDLLENRVVDLLEQIGIFELFTQDPKDWESHGSWKVAKRDGYLTKEGNSMDMRPLASKEMTVNEVRS